MQRMAKITVADSKLADETLFSGQRVESAGGFAGTIPPCPQGVCCVEIPAGRQAAVAQVKRPPGGRQGAKISIHVNKHLALQARTELVEGVQHL